ncbi:helix-turn-helix domain-containing protein (plasmid) [Streptomyces sp. NBC_01267]|uniref:helix-turn-helix domain-containing protein n=1 Tax=unclassified Streptomyces TaxID=2593676 RepID=UPI002023F15A|nr:MULTISPECIES: helix-turn-helix domain-containing protein [unclassified Streptomyces]
MDSTAEDGEGTGRRLRELRRARGLKQQDLASDDVSVSYISLIESGKRTPSAAVVTLLAERLGCTPSYLLTGQDGTRTRELELKAAFADLALHNGENREALQAFSEILASGPVLPEATVRRARLGQALALEQLGRLEAAAQALTMLYEDPRCVAGSAEWTQLATALCRCHQALGDQVLSVEIGERALRRLDQFGLEATDDHIQLGAVLVSCYRARSDLAKARLVAERLIRIADGHGGRTAQRETFWNAALVAKSQGQIDEALALAERARALLAESDHVRHHALLCGVYGMLLLCSDPGDPEQARQLLEQSQAQLVEVGTAAEQASAQSNLAEAHLRLNQAAEAQEHASRALELLRDEPRRESVEARAVLAHAQFGMGESRQAQETLRAAAAQLRQLPPARPSAAVWRRIADIWQQYGYTAESIAAYRQALNDAGLPGLPASADRVSEAAR